MLAWKRKKKRRRSGKEVYAAVLEVALEGEKKTRIMYSAGLSYAMFSKCLKLLLKQGMLEYDKIDNIYRTTQKGRKFLRMWEDLKL
jgi:predicted transcriptional regulator